MEKNLDHLLNTLTLETEDEKLAAQFSGLTTTSGNSGLISTPKQATHGTFGVMRHESTTLPQKKAGAFDVPRKSWTSDLNPKPSQQTLETEKQEDGWGEAPHETAISEYYKFGQTCFLSSEHLNLGHVRFNQDYLGNLADLEANKVGFTKYSQGEKSDSTASLGGFSVTPNNTGWGVDVDAIKR